MKNRAIYIHIPFCEKKCLYCNFVSFVSDEQQHNEYFSALQSEILQSENFDGKIGSVYFGGGTPSCVDEKYISHTMKVLKQKFTLSNNAEISIECNPNSVTLEKLKEYKKAGFNRLSFGAQSFDNNILKKLGRIHNVNQIFSAISLAKQAGFKNINIDLMIGIDKLNFIDLKEKIAKIKTLGVTHLSVYMLILEQNTPLFNQVKTKKVKVLDDDSSVSEYNKVFQLLKEFDYERYEVSNFALNGFQCRHNLTYWNCLEYYGFGLNAHSFIDGKRYSNTTVLSEYLAKPFNIKKIRINEEVLTKSQKIEEYIMLSLRTKYGLSLEKLKQLGCDILTEKKQEINQLLKNNIISVKDEHICICEDYFGVMNQIILRLI